MFNFVHERKRFVQIVLLLIILPFTFWGMDSFNQSSDGDAPATVNGDKISQQEFDQELRQQQDRMREAMGANYDPSMLDKPEAKHSILENLVNQHLLLSQASHAGLAATDSKLAKNISTIQEFQKDGKFDKQLFESVLRNQKRSPLAFEESVAQRLNMRQLVDSYTRNGYASLAVAENLVRLNEQQRVVAVAQITTDSFLSQENVDDATVKSYYDMNQKEFQADELARVEYVTFSAEALQSQVGVDDAEVKKYYDEHQTEFGTQEQRHALHILISVSPQAPDTDKQVAKTKAEQVLQQVQQAPAKFPALAKQYSQDPGSAAQGGDLGTFGRGMMVKPFEDAVFGLKVGEISGLVLSDFGYHIIKLLAVDPSKIQPLDQARQDIALKIKKQKANDKFAELAEKFSNTVYEQSDSLKPAAELVKMPVQQSGWLSRGGAGTLPWTAKGVQAVFSDDVLKNKRNSAATEVAPNTLLAARLLEYKPASIRRLAEVGDGIRQKLLRQKAAELALKQGKTALAQLQQGSTVGLEWKAAISVTREKHTGLDENLAQKVFQVNASKFPVYVGVENAQGGYMLARVEEVRDVAEIDAASRARNVQKLRQLTGDELFKAYLADIKTNASIKIKSFAAPEK